MVRERDTEQVYIKQRGILQRRGKTASLRREIEFQSPLYRDTSLRTLVRMSRGSTERAKSLAKIQSIVNETNVTNYRRFMAYY